ncbi:MAG TPA: XRE family transcriptional regulator [Gaiellaceae bacterium]|nr:XRE family transcriptional regulator [Gaiellaceae bacterium]
MSAQSHLEAGDLTSMLGPRLRERRTELSRTLAEVARAAALSTGYLSSIEKGASIPSLPVLARIAHALGVSLADILRSSGPARFARGHISDAAGEDQLAAEGSQIQVIRSGASPGEAGDAPVALGNGDIFVFVYRGRLAVTVDDGVFELGPGDALHCDRPKKLTWRVPGDEPAVALWAGRASSLRAQRG